MRRLVACHGARERLAALQCKGRWRSNGPETVNRLIAWAMSGYARGGGLLRSANVRLQSRLASRSPLLASSIPFGNYRNNCIGSVLKMQRRTGHFERHAHDPLGLWVELMAVQVWRDGHDEAPGFRRERDGVSQPPTPG
jgi:hypothetical protein